VFWPPGCLRPERPRERCLLLLLPCLISASHHICLQLMGSFDRLFNSAGDMALQTIALRAAHTARLLPKALLLRRPANLQDLKRPHSHQLVDHLFDLDPRPYRRVFQPQNEKKQKINHILHCMHRPIPAKSFQIFVSYALISFSNFATSAS